MSEFLNTLASPSLGPEGSDAQVSSACLNADAILAFAQGLLKGAQLEQAHEHIDQCSLCQRLVTEAVHALDAEVVTDSTRLSWNTVFRNNAIVGRRYRIIRLVARGGMGEVYEAFDTELQERLALKTVTSTACDSVRAVRWLKAEVQLARRISHPNVCRIYDFRTHVVESSDTVVNFLVMEFVDGECLGQRLRQTGPLPMDEALSVAYQLLLGLHAAHQEGILHRDFKSDNVMLRTKSGGRIVPVILDFGLAKALNESGNVSGTLNQAQAVVGTIGYMSPEQLEGKPLSTASDIYSFGAVWFELLTGRLPFVGESPVAAAMARLHVEPPAPSSINPDIPRWLDDIVLCCLSRSRETRFNSAQQVVDALARRTAPPSLSRSVKPGWVAGVAIGLVAVPLGILWSKRAQPRAELSILSATPIAATATTATATAATATAATATAATAMAPASESGSTSRVSSDSAPPTGSAISESEKPSPRKHRLHERPNRPQTRTSDHSQEAGPLGPSKQPDWIPLE